MLKIPSPQGAYNLLKVPLGGVTYDFSYRYNSYTESWQLDIYLNNIPVALGESLVPMSPLFYGNPILNFTHGVLIVLPNYDTTTPCGLNNLGIDEDYTLIYLTNEEWDNA